jgi:hypothetical protein
MQKSRRIVVAGACLTVAFLVANEKNVDNRAACLDRISDQSLVNIARIPASDLQTQTDLKRPIVITGLLNTWPATNATAVSAWSFESLRNRIGQSAVDCGSANSDSQIPFYAIAFNATGRGRGRHDLDMYVFDSDFSEASGKATLLEDISALDSLAGDDVFAQGLAFSHQDRPAWRWLLAGPPGSGSCLHQDPWGYSSWNASVVGRKRWVLFPPDTPFATLHPPRDNINFMFAWIYTQLASLMGIRQIPRGASEFMDAVLPSLRGRGLGEVEIVQLPGEVVAFPAGWWHAVVNLDATIAVTESFGKRRDLEDILSALCKDGRHEFAAVLRDEQGATQKSSGDSSNSNKNNNSSSNNNDSSSSSSSSSNDINSRIISNNSNI